MGVAAEGFGAEAGNGTVGKGAAEVTGGHLVDAVAGEGLNGIGEGEVLDSGGNGTSVVGAAQLALVTADDPVACHSRDPVGQLFVMVLDEQAGEAARGIGGTILAQCARRTRHEALATVATGHRAWLVGR